MVDQTQIDRLRLLDVAPQALFVDGSWQVGSGGSLDVLSPIDGSFLTTLAVAWVAANSAITCPIISARSVAQLAPSLAALDYELSDTLKAQLTALTPTPAPATDRLEEA